MPSRGAAGVLPLPGGLIADAQLRLLPAWPQRRQTTLAAVATVQGAPESSTLQPANVRIGTA